MNTLAIALVAGGTMLIYWALKPGAAAPSSSAANAGTQPATQGSTGQSGLDGSGSAGQGVGGGGGGSW